MTKTINSYQTVLESISAHTTKCQNQMATAGFTLVELLVVISIIGMLAGLLLPAVNAAREAGRRAVCMNNQSQLALACINYDGAKQNLPPMRGKIGESSGGDYNVASWIGFILPYMEQNQLYQNLSNVTINSTDTSDNYYGYQLIRIKSLLCPSAEQPSNTNSGTHYVCNGGYQNAVGKGWDSPIFEWSAGIRIEPGKAADAPFLDHWAYSSASQRCTTKVSIDYISSHSGTSNVILLSENERPITGGINSAGGTGARWAYWDGGEKMPLVSADSEERIAFCYPFNTATVTVKEAEQPSTDTTDTDTTDTESGSQGTSAAASTEPVTTITITGATLVEYGDSKNWSYEGYKIASSSSVKVPAFVNAERENKFRSGYEEYRHARPSSNHPGIVLAAFADRSVRPLSESMDQRIFVWICQPNSGQVISGDSF